MKRAICVLLLMFAFVLPALAADVKPLEKLSATTEPVLVPVDLDSRIEMLTKQREQLLQASQKNAQERQQIETNFAAVSGALVVLTDMKKGAEPKTK